MPALPSYRMKIFKPEASETMLRDETNFFHKESQRKLRPLQHNVNSSSSVRDGDSGSPPKMFLWSKPQQEEQPARNIYKKIRTHDILDKRKTATALKDGENRALYLGLAMLVCSSLIAFLLGIKVVQHNKESVWTEVSKCTVLEARITNCRNCKFNCGPDCWKPSQSACLQVYVNLSSSGMKVLLHQSEETVRFNSECFCTSNCKRNHSENKMLLASLKENITQFQSFPCYYDPKGRQRNVLLARFDMFNALCHAMLWPSCMFLGGIVLVVLVKLTQYLSLLSEQSK
ncbi:calcium-activated potassium channel subunit beta-2 [Pristis pectinata]|uniref:calcium-activated potassium channel subunit beta-2 n=1 Tax=Pristis pectinata TaxID=685728 RepID=UPI00223D7642|nr:calcium-activated potassium channel subunit beta-2 [Pristis pectinata]